MNAKEVMNKFFYRNDVFAVKTSKGFYVPVRRPVTLSDIQKHLDGKHVIGAYQSRSDETCTWGCVDFDSKDYEIVAKKIAREYTTNNSNKDVMFEETNKGFHVWFFFGQVIPTSAAYGFIKSVVLNEGLRIGLKHKIDIFPRSPHLSGKRVGGLVKIPREKLW